MPGRDASSIEQAMQQRLPELVARMQAAILQAPLQHRLGGTGLEGSPGSIGKIGDTMQPGPAARALVVADEVGASVHARELDQAFRECRRASTADIVGVEEEIGVAGRATLTDRLSKQCPPHPEPVPGRQGPSLQIVRHRQVPRGPAAISDA